MDPCYNPIPVGSGVIIESIFVSLYCTSVWKCPTVAFVFVHNCLSLNNTFFSSPGSVFDWFCRFKTILLALCGNPWIWIACPPWEYIGRRFFFLFSIGWKYLQAWISCLFFLLLSSKSHQVCIISPSPRRSWGFFFHLPSVPFLPPQFKHFWIRFFLFSGSLCTPISFVR